MTKSHLKNRLGLPAEHERAPSFHQEVTPIMKGGSLEKKIKTQTRKNK